MSLHPHLYNPPKNAVLDRAAITEYEVGASWWPKYVKWKWARALAGKYFRWKVKRKADRYERAIATKKWLISRGY